jgi:hypothetical protein
MQEVVVCVLCGWRTGRLATTIRERVHIKMLTCFMDLDKKIEGNTRVTLRDTRKGCPTGSYQRLSRLVRLSPLCLREVTLS